MITPVIGLGENFQYSFEEQATNKTWLDGEPIYRKTFAVPESSVADSSVSIPIGFSVGDFFKILDGGVQRTATFYSDYVPLPFVDQATGYNIQVSSTPAKDTIVVNNGANSEHVGGWITIEYTKA